MKYLIIFLLLVSGCGFGRRDVIHPDGTYESTTVWTLFKEIEWGKYSSENNKIKAFGGAGYIESE